MSGTRSRIRTFESASCHLELRTGADTRSPSARSAVDPPVQANLSPSGDGKGLHSTANLGILVNSVPYGL